jgi:hypothetical protein
MRRGVMFDTDNFKPRFFWIEVQVDDNVEGMWTPSLYTRNTALYFLASNHANLFRHSLCNNNTDIYQMLANT